MNPLFARASDAAGIESIVRRTSQLLVAEFSHTERVYDGRERFFSRQAICSGGQN